MAPRRALALVLLLAGIMLLPFAALGWFHEDWHIGEDWDHEWVIDHDDRWSNDWDDDWHHDIEIGFSPRINLGYSGPLDD